MLLAQADVHPTTEQPGSAEISEDKVSVYARTFAEPYAATRFFPAALKLSENQLVALHIHEALHRALPADVREDENKVMLMTLAITSPGASFDRVSNIANLYLRPVPPPASALATSVASEPVFVRPERSKAILGYTAEVYSTSPLSTMSGVTFHKLELGASLGGYQKVGRLAVEPYFRGRYLANSTYAELIGLPSLELQGRMKIDEATIAPFVRINAKSISSPTYFGPSRDIVSLGANYVSETSRNYSDATAFYSFPSTSSFDDGYRRTEIHYNSIVTLAARGGYALGRLLLGGLGELHMSQGFETSERSSYSDFSAGSSAIDSFRILVLGPEIGYRGDRFRFKLHYKMMLNDTQNLDALGDPLDRGASTGGVGASFSMTL
jgi:hypothetical protein